MGGSFVRSGTPRAEPLAVAQTLLGARPWTSERLHAIFRGTMPDAKLGEIDVLVDAVRARFGEDPRPLPLLRTLARFIQEVELEAADDEDEEPSEPADDSVIDVPTSDPAMLPARGAPETWSVPAITSFADLVTWLGVGAFDLGVLIAPGSSRRVGLGALRHYAVETRAKTAGGVRVLERPKTLMKRVQRRILRGILDHIPPHGVAHGFVRGRSSLTHARLHAAREIVLRFDLRDFFAHVHGGAVLAIFRTAGYPEPVSRALLALTTHALSTTALRELAIDVQSPIGRALRIEHLPQGAPTSPALANLAAFRLDVRLAGLARKLDATYSRYADDLVISGDRRLARHIGGIEARVGAIALEHGFALQHKKTRVQPTSTRQVVGGWVVNVAPAIARADYDRLRAMIHDAVHHGPERANRARHPRFREHIEGSIARVAESSPHRAEKLRALAAQIAW